MIVPSMTDFEILEEIKKDLPQMDDYMTFVNCGRKYRKILQARKPKGDKFIFVIDDWMEKPSVFDPRGQSDVAPRKLFDLYG